MAEENTPTTPTFSTKEDLFTAITDLQSAVADLQVQFKELNQAQPSDEDVSKDEPDEPDEPDLEKQADEIDSWLGA